MELMTTKTGAKTSQHESQTTKNTQTAHRHGQPALFWLSSYVAHLRLAVAPQSAAKDQFYRQSRHNLMQQE
jgi:hypothetical protein